MMARLYAIVNVMYRIIYGHLPLRRIVIFIIDTPTFEIKSDIFSYFLYIR